MMKKPWVFICIFCLTILQLSNIQAQRIEKRISISWKDNITQVVDEELIQEFLTFEQATYRLDFPTLPCYFERTACSAFYTDYAVSISDVQYEQLNAHDAALIPSDYHCKQPEVVVTSAYERATPYMALTFIPIVETGERQFSKITSITVSIEGKSPELPKAKKSYSTRSVLASGNWYTFHVTETGIYKVTYENLIAMGMATPIYSSSLSVFGNGGGMLPEANSAPRQDDLRELAILISDGGDNIIDAGDYFLFYGESPHAWTFDTNSGHFSHATNIYSDSTCYFITNSSAVGEKRRVVNVSNNGLTANQTVSTYIHYDFHEQDLHNFSETGKFWVGETFDASTQQNFGFRVPGCNQQPGTITVSAINSSSSYAHFNISSNGNPIGALGMPSSNGAIAARNSQAFDFTPSANGFSIMLDYNKPTASSTAYLDWIEIEVPCNLTMHSAQFPFCNPATIGSGNVTRFNIGNANSSTNVWDVTDPAHINKMVLSQESGSYGFTASTDILRKFVAFDGTEFLTIVPGKAIQNQNLHGEVNIDMVIVTHPKFLAQANQLAEFRQQNNGLNVKVVTTDEVYNEFSSGKLDPMAIRDYMKMIYDRTDKQYPKYLLLVGRPSYDFRGRINGTEIFVPNYQYDIVNNTVAERNFYSNDDTFCLLDDNEGGNMSGFYDMAVGRFPCSTVAQARTAVEKSINYTEKRNLVNEGSSQISNFGDWRNMMAITADDEEGNDFIQNADAFCDSIKKRNPNINFDKIYLDAFTQVSNAGGQRYPDVTTAINNRMNRGSLFFTYIGHSGKDGWTAERVLENSDINRWTNKYNLPAMLTLSCTFGYYDRPAISPAELVLFNSNGGASAIITTTREAWSLSNNDYGRRFFSSFFKKTDDRYRTIGELEYYAKNLYSGASSSLAMLVLMGDPSMPLAIPTYNIVTDSINHQPVGTQTDTIRALSKMTVSGRVVDENGQTLSNMNGSVYPSVYDKAVVATTLANDPNSQPFDFEVQKNILFKGNCSVNNGHFTFSFYVPKDIDYTYGNGKISYYAASTNQDAAGAFSDFIIGGTDTNGLDDKEGPSIELFLNDENFVSGGITNSDPTLIAKIRDNYGINTTGNGIGHDLTAILDDATDAQIVLNDYYQTEKDSFNAGTVRYKLSDLSLGKHTIMVRAWDINNNHSESELTFEVVSNEGLVLSHVLNYPNPFTTHTDFYFEHNRDGGVYDIQVQIYTISGKIVKTINTTQFIEGSRCEAISWDGLDDYGDKLGKGVYMYKIKVRNENNETAEAIEKLVIL